mgnify:CR=1 FL=1
MAKAKDENSPVTWRDEVSGVSVAADVGINSYPTLQFLSGKQGMAGHWRANGAFFVADGENVTTQWGKADFLTNDGETVPGSVSQDIECSVIRLRRCWVVKDSDKVTRRIPWNSFDAAKNLGKPRGKCQILMAVTGINELVALSLTGMQSAYAMSRDGWGGMARKKLYDPTARILHTGKRGGIERLPALQFRILVGPEMQGDKPVYTRVGIDSDSQMITKIVLKSPIATVESDADVARHIVPRVIRESYETAYHDAEEWAHAWDEKQSGDIGGYGNIPDEMNE